ncbi:MAG: hypothetical protein V4662_13100 [Verrucomicrobiota bacterium]
MNKTFEMLRILLLGVFAFAGTVRGQEPDPEAYPWVRLANATGLDGRIQVLIKGRNVNPEGYESGAVTGAFSLYTGETEFTIKHPQIDDTKFMINLNPNDRMAVVIYTEPDKKQGDVLKKRQVKFTTLKRKAKGDKKSATLLFISPNKGIDIGMNDAPVSLVANQQKDIHFAQSRGSQVVLTVRGKPLRTLDIDEPGDYAIIVFDNPDGTQGCITFNNTRI